MYSPRSVIPFCLLALALASCQGVYSQSQSPSSEVAMHSDTSKPAAAVHQANAGGTGNTGGTDDTGGAPDMHQEGHAPGFGIR
jgi:hypothetical protein